MDTRLIKTHGLRTKLLTPFILGAVALTFALTWYTYASARKAVFEAMVMVSESKTAQVVSAMDLLLRSMASSVQNMTADQHVIALFTQADKEKTLEEATDWLTMLEQSNEYYRDILVVDEDGICIASNNESNIGESLSGNGYVEAALKGWLNFGRPSVGRITKKLSAVVAAPVDIGGRIAGAVIFYNDVPRIVDYNNKLDNDMRWLATSILSPDGRFLTHADRQMMDAPAPFHSLFEQLREDAENDGITTFELLGERYVGFAKLEPTTNCVVVTAGLENKVFSSVYRRGAVVLGISLFFLCAATLLVARFTNGILSSLFALIGYAKQVSEGDLTVSLKDSTRTDELGTLHVALQRLVDSLGRMIEETRQANTMKGEFLANMSHEIRTPLNAIIGITHLASKVPSQPKELTDYLYKIHLSAKALLGIINDILDLSKVEAGMLELERLPFSLHQTITNALAIHEENAALKGLALTCEYEAGAPQNFYGDELRIGQIFNNLLSNAVKFTNKGGITIRCSQKHCAGLPENHVMMEISVTDTGIGMSREFLDKIFQPFTQADTSISRRYGGTGLGLSISSKLVELLGGIFEVESEEGKGATFSFSLPLEINLKPDTSFEAYSNDDGFNSLDLRGKVVLVAEDNLINQEIVVGLTEPTGVRLVMANNGEEAVKAAAEQRFDLALMDLQMPIMGGIEATRRIREFLSAEELPIIAVTANAMAEDRERCLQNGMNGYLTKPLEPVHLFTVLSTWLGPDAKRDTSHGNAAS